MDSSGIAILDVIAAGLENGGLFRLDPNTVTMFGNLLAASVALDEASGRPTPEQLEATDAETRVLLTRFWRAVDQLKGWTAAPADEPQVRLVDRTGAPLSAKQRRRLVAVH